MDCTIKAISLSKNYMDAPVVVVSEAADGKGCRIIIIHSDFESTNLPISQKLAHNIQLVHLGEAEVLNSILNDDGAVVSRYFIRPIVIKDELKIVSLIMGYVDEYSFDSPPICGNLVVRFSGNDESRSLCSNTLIPFYNVVSNYIEYADSFCLFSHYWNGLSFVYACWDFPEGQVLDYVGLMRHTVKTIPELNLHALRITHNPVKSCRISFLQKWSTSFYMPLFASDVVGDAVIREVFYQYLSIGKFLFDSPLDFILHNNMVLKKSIPYSYSFISQRVIDNSLKGSLQSKILNEYGAIVKQNYEALLLLIEQTCSQWQGLEVKHLPNDVSMELKNMLVAGKNHVLFRAYHTIFSGSLINPFHLGLFPYCISELLPIVSKI